ncbi:hypothetical protein ABIE67_009108 [Streptomyces sp. V4I8]
MLLSGEFGTPGDPGPNYSLRDFTVPQLEETIDVGTP